MLPTCRLSISLAAVWAPYRSKSTFTKPSLNREPSASCAFTTSLTLLSQSLESASVLSSPTEDTTTYWGTAIPHFFISPIPGPSRTLAMSLLLRCCNRRLESGSLAQTASGLQFPKRPKRALEKGLPHTPPAHPARYFTRACLER